MIRAAVLAVRMSLEPVASLDILRYLRVPAIVWVLRRSTHCHRSDCRSRRRASRTR